MSCPHGLHSTPETCSLCAGASPRRVEIEGNTVTIDGEPARAAQPRVWSPALRRQQRRGGKR